MYNDKNRKILLIEQPAESLTRARKREASDATKDDEFVPNRMKKEEG